MRIRRRGKGKENCDVSTKASTAQGILLIMEASIKEEKFGNDRLRYCNPRVNPVKLFHVKHGELMNAVRMALLLLRRPIVTSRLADVTSWSWNSLAFVLPACLT